MSRPSSSRPRTTLCISSQVGCAQNCQFCFTGRMGLQGNLSTAQIVEQVPALPTLRMQSPGCPELWSHSHARLWQPGPPSIAASACLQYSIRSHGRAPEDAAGILHVVHRISRCSAWGDSCMWGYCAPSDVCTQGTGSSSAPQRVIISMLCMAWLQVVEARRHVAVHHARVASGALPPAQQIAPITNVVFMVRARTASQCSSSGSMSQPTLLSPFYSHTSARKHLCRVATSPGAVKGCCDKEITCPEWPSCSSL